MVTKKIQALVKYFNVGIHPFFKTYFHQDALPQFRFQLLQKEHFLGGEFQPQVGELHSALTRPDPWWPWLQ